MTSTVIIHVGLSGSGKSTSINNSISKHKENKQTYGVCSADHYFLKDSVYRFDYTKLGEAHKQSQKNFQYMLGEGIEWIYVDNTNLTKKERAFYLKNAFDAGANVLVYVHPVDVALSEARNIHNVPRETLERMATKLDLEAGVYTVTQNMDGTFKYHFVGGLK